MYFAVIFIFVKIGFLEPEKCNLLNKENNKSAGMNCLYNLCKLWMRFISDRKILSTSICMEKLVRIFRRMEEYNSPAPSLLWKNRLYWWKV